jgi:benzodiazapine receptor
MEGCRVSAVPSWLLILVLLVLPLLAINPSPEDYAWMMRLSRPPWLVGLQVWTPLLWLVIYAFLLGSALTTWQAEANWRLLLAYPLLLLLIKGHTWLLCRTHRLDYGAMASGISWMYGLGLAVKLAGISPSSAVGLLPFLLWSPVEIWSLWRMRRMNR